MRTQTALVLSVVVSFGLGLAGCDGLVEVNNHYDAAPVASQTIIVQSPQTPLPVTPPQIAPVYSPSINLAAYSRLTGYFDEGAEEAPALSVDVGNSNEEPIRTKRMMLSLESTNPGGAVPNCDYVRLLISCVLRNSPDLPFPRPFW